jgi:hypothetical protein
MHGHMNVIKELDLQCMVIIENLILIDLFNELSVTEIIQLIHVTVHCQ